MLEQTYYLDHNKWALETFLKGARTLDWELSRSMARHGATIVLWKKNGWWLPLGRN